jgi:hypothetical protein
MEPTYCNLRSDQADDNYHIKLQKERYADVFGHEMPESTMSAVKEIFISLQGLYFADCGSASNFEDSKYWEELSEGRLHVSKCVGETLLSDQQAARASEHGGDSCVHQDSALRECGFAVQSLPSPLSQDVLDALAATTKRLRAAGWPVTFLMVSLCCLFFQVNPCERTLTQTNETANIFIFMNASIT